MPQERSVATLLCRAMRHGSAITRARGTPWRRAACRWLYMSAMIISVLHIRYLRAIYARRLYSRDVLLRAKMRAGKRQISRRDFTPPQCVGAPRVRTF